MQVLKGINIAFGAGQVVSIIGPNASGKTTLMKCLLGMVIPDKGTILFNGKDIQDNDTYRRYIGYMPQIGRYPDNMTAGRLIEMMKDLRKDDNDAPPDEELIKAFGLSSIAKKSMRSLSGGTRQKVSAALAFLFNPDVLILDEPTAGLDPESAEILKSKIIWARENGKLVLVTSHIMSEVAEISDRVLSLLEGRAIFYKPVADILSEMQENRFSKAIVKMINQCQPY